jgi:TonB family protein
VLNLPGRGGAPMSETWKQWEGQVVDAKFPLSRYLGGSEHSAVFLTERGAPPQKAAIKFIQVDEPDAELQLFRWKHAASLSHPHLLRIFDSGRCRLGDFDLLYVVMEFAEENLSQFLPQRPLTPAEARDVLTPTLRAITFLHSEGLVHGHVRPSNILAIEDQLKLSSDGVFSIADHADQSHLPASQTQLSAATSLRHPSPYDPPEIAKGLIFPAGDIWSLGITLVEALTQHLPASAASPAQDPVVPDTLPAVFLDIARHCLQRDPLRRWTVAEIAARLNPGSVAPPASPAKPAYVPPAAPIATVAAPAVIPPAATSHAPVPPLAAAKTESARPAPPPASKPPVHIQTVAVRGTSTRPRYDLVQPSLKRPPLLPLPKFNYLPLAIVAALVLAAIFIAPRLFHHRAPVQQAAAVEAPQPPPAAKPTPAAARTKNPSKSAQKSISPTINATSPSSSRTSPLAPQSSLQKTSDKRSLNPSTPAPVALTSAAGSSRVDSAANPAAAGSVTQGEVLDQIMPDVSSRARATIRGTVRVTVKLHVDPTGNVASAELSSPGPSKYFADQALQAAHRWDFAPAKVDGHAVASNWLVRFEFTPSVTKVQPTQSTP